MDVNSNVDNPVIGLRSFGENPEAVSEKGIAYARGLENTGILSVSKHYPSCAITGPAWIAWNFFLLNVIYMMGSAG